MKAPRDSAFEAFPLWSLEAAAPLTQEMGMDFFTRVGAQGWGAAGHKMADGLLEEKEGWRKLPMK